MLWHSKRYSAEDSQNKSSCSDSSEPTATAGSPACPANAIHGIEDVFLADGGFGSGAITILNTAFPVVRHYSGLRDSGTRGASIRRANGDSGSFWLAERIDNIAVGAAISNLGFGWPTFGLTTGADPCPVTHPCQP